MQISGSDSYARLASKYGSSNIKKVIRVMESAIKEHKKNSNKEIEKRKLLRSLRDKVLEILHKKYVYVEINSRLNLNDLKRIDHRCNKLNTTKAVEIISEMFDCNNPLLIQTFDVRIVDKMITLTLWAKDKFNIEE